MLKTTILLEKLTSRQLKINDNKVNKFDIGSSKEIAKKSKKLLKSQKLAKLGKKLSKSGNLLKSNTKKTGPSFLTSDARTVFNRLWLAFTKALIF